MPKSIRQVRDHRQVVPEGERLVKAWLSETEMLERARGEVRRRECDLANSANALAKWMLPDDAKPGEKIAIWYGDSLIQVEKHAEMGRDPVITIRKRGRKLYAA